VTPFIDVTTGSGVHKVTRQSGLRSAIEDAQRDEGIDLVEGLGGDDGDVHAGHFAALWPLIQAGCSLSLRPAACRMPAAQPGSPA
jgi:hypothetical protein